MIYIGRLDVNLVFFEKNKNVAKKNFFDFICFLTELTDVFHSFENEERDLSLKLEQKEINSS